MRELILIRHGETVFKSEERLQGGHDSPLTEKGEGEARKLGEALRKCCGPVHAWYVSPQGRARQTSKILRDTWQQGTTAVLPEEQVHDDIAEIRCGDWEGLQRSEIPAAELQRVHLSTDIAYPNGESVLDVSQRCMRFLGDWRRGLPETTSDGVHRTIVVSHGNLVRCMGGVLSGLGPDFAITAMKNNTAVSRFFTRAPLSAIRLAADAKPAPDGISDIAQKARAYMLRLLSWNHTGHLQDGNPFFAV